MPDEKDIVLIEENAKVNHPEIVADIFNKHYKSIISDKFLINSKHFCKEFHLFQHKHKHH